MNLLYKILFEVKVFHEYYLTDPDNTSVFQDAQQTQRLAWLDRRYKTDQPAGSDDLRFVLSPAMIRSFKNQGLRLLNSLSGFQVAVRVSQTTQSNGTVTYTPAIPLADDFNMLILLQQSNGGFGPLTNGRLQRPIQSLYYFSNVDLGTAKTAPVLSRPISAQVAGFPYEQGELSLNGADIEFCYYNGTTPAFEAVPGNGFVNENDRLVVGRTFDYTFLPSDNVSQAQFILKDQSGNTVRTWTTGGTTTLNVVTVNFDDASNPALTPLVTLPRAAASDPILYSLVVTGTGAYSKTVPLIFYENPSDLMTTWGIVQIQANVAGNNFSLLDTNGNLYKPALPAPENTESPYPVFEIRCKSRYTFWRYISEDPTMNINAPTGTIAEFLQGAAGVLTSLYPIPKTYLPWFFSQDPTATPPAFTYLPNPAPDTVIEVSGKQLFSDIWVPASGVFPVSPAPP